MGREIVYAHENVWLPKAVRDGAELRLEFVGGADALHDPRAFSIPIRAEHVEALRTDLARHLILSSALGPLCFAAGVAEPIDERAAVALLDPILLASAGDVDTFLAHSDWERAPLVAHGADVELLERGRILESLRAVTAHADWKRAQEYEADQRRARRGVTLTALDAAILRFTGQFVHGSTIPHRDPDAVDPALLPEVLRVIHTAERAAAEFRIARDARQGPTGTDKADWKRMQAGVEEAVRTAHAGLAADAVSTVSFLLCAEAAKRVRSEPFDPDASEHGVRARARTLTFTDDAEVTSTWNAGGDDSAVEAFWAFVAERVGTRNDVFTLEDEARGEGVQVHFYASSIARVATVSRARGGEPEYRVEYAIVDDLAHYRTLVRACIAGGFDALDELAQWYPDADSFEQARRRRRTRPDV